MFDYVEISKYLPDGYFDRSNIDIYKRLRNDGAILKVNYNENKQVLSIKGSLPYFVQGHNFFFDLNGVKTAINMVSKLLDVDLYDAEVKIIEYGVVVCPKFGIDDFTSSHLSTRGYNRDVYEKGGMLYRRKDKAYKLKFYSLWANIDDTENKISKENRRMLECSHLGRRNNPMRYEIHGNPRKILNCNKVMVSDIVTEEFENKCKAVLLKRYRQLKKRERLSLTNMYRLDSLKIVLALLSEYCYTYQDEIIRMIDRTEAKEDAKKMRRTFFRQKFRSIPHEKCNYSIEELIVEALDG